MNEKSISYKSRAYIDSLFPKVIDRVLIKEEDGLLIKYAKRKNSFSVKGSGREKGVKLPISE